MQVLIHYSHVGFDVNDFNYAARRSHFLADYNYFKDKNMDFTIGYSNESALDMVRLMVVEKLIDKNNILFIFNKHRITIDDDGIFSEYPPGFGTLGSDLSTKIMEVRTKNYQEQMRTQS